MAFWRLYYHLAWATKNRFDLISDEIEGRLFANIISKSDSMECQVHAIGGMPNHIHVIATIPPKLSIVDYISRIKGASSHFANHMIPDYKKKFAWQDGYGAFSLGGKQLDSAIHYVLNQKEHHRNGTTHTQLETFTDKAPPPNDPPSLP
jgi:putative transposase